MNELAAELLQSEIIDPFKQSLKSLFNIIIGDITAGQSRGGAGGLLDAGFNFLFGGGGGHANPISGYSISPGNAYNGGDIRAAGLAMVGERGPEMLSLPKGARVTPLDLATRRGGGNSFNISIVSEDRVAMKRVVQQELPNIIAAAEANMLTKSRGNSRVARAFG